MPCEARFRLELTLAEGLPRPNARLWLDTSADYQLDSGEEVPLTSADRAVWIGVRTFEERSNLNGVFFLLRFVAPQETIWRFEARCGEHVIYATQEALVMSDERETLTGYCHGQVDPAEPTVTRPLEPRRRWRDK